MPNQPYVTSTTAVTAERRLDVPKHAVLCLCASAIAKEMPPHFLLSFRRAGSFFSVIAGHVPRLIRSHAPPGPLRCPVLTPACQRTRSPAGVSTRQPLHRIRIIAARACFVTRCSLSFPFLSLLPAHRKSVICCRRISCPSWNGDAALSRRLIPTVRPAVVHHHVNPMPCLEVCLCHPRFAPCNCTL